MSNIYSDMKGETKNENTDFKDSSNVGDILNNSLSLNDFS